MHPAPSDNTVRCVQSQLVYRFFARQGTVRVEDGGLLDWCGAGEGGGEGTIHLPGVNSTLRIRYCCWGWEFFPIRRYSTSWCCCFCLESDRSSTHDPDPPPPVPGNVRLALSGRCFGLYAQPRGYLWCDFENTQRSTCNVLGSVSHMLVDLLFSLLET